MIRYNVEIHLASGSVVKVTADARDFAKLEMQPFGFATHKLTSSRFLAWSAMSRDAADAGTPRMSFDRFNEVECVDVVELDQPEGEGEQGLDPGRKTRSGSAGSTSPEKAGNR